MIVSKPDGMQREMQGIPIIDVESFGAVNGHLKIFVAVGAMHHQSIEQTLQKNGCENYELLDDAFLGSF